MMLRVLTCSLLLVSSIGTVLAQEGGSAFIEREDLGSGPSRIYATLSVANPTVQVGSRISFEVCFHNGGESKYQKFYDLDFNPLEVDPAQIALYDSNKKYVVDLLVIRHMDGSGSSIGANGGDLVPPLGRVITKLSLKVSLSWVDVAQHHQLSPGDYYLQVIYFKALVRVPYMGDSGAKELDRTELLRTNPVKITLTK